MSYLQNFQWKITTTDCIKYQRSSLNSYFNSMQVSMYVYRQYVYSQSYFCAQLNEKNSSKWNFIRNVYTNINSDRRNLLLVNMHAFDDGQIDLNTKYIHFIWHIMNIDQFDVQMHSKHKQSLCGNATDKFVKQSEKKCSVNHDVW